MTSYMSLPHLKLWNGCLKFVHLFSEYSVMSDNSKTCCSIVDMQICSHLLDSFIVTGQTGFAFIVLVELVAHLAMSLVRIWSNWLIRGRTSDAS